ncbi:SLC13 family permease [Halosimplex marinum]|uniref:SLC13 family permease n=1 Tax=Halosimplex marinum TaxID=3396620 RepID=UPI003F551355
MVLGLSTGTLVVFALVAVALVLFVSEWLPPDITAIGVLVALAVLEPYTGVTATDALQGFASRAVVTIIAMYVLSAGIEETGVVDYLGAVLAEVTGGDEGRLLGATVGVTGFSAGFVNNTPVVAVFIPMITGLSEEAGISPSKLLMPLSFAAMLGGTLTLVGTSTTLLASDFSRDLLGHPLSMFEITPVGVVVLAVGLAYLLTVGRWLVPERIPAAADFTDEFDLDRHLGVLVVREDSPLVGRTVAEALDDGELPEDDLAEGTAVEVPRAGDEPSEPPTAGDGGPEPADPDVDVLQVERDGDAFVASATDRELRAGDRLTVRGSLRAVNGFAARHGLTQRSREAVTEDRLVAAPHDATLVEAVVHPESRVAGRTVGDLRLRERFDTTVLAVRRGGELVREDLDGTELQRGDALLLQTDAATADYFEEAGYLVVTERALADEGDEPSPEPVDAETTGVSATAESAAGETATAVPSGPGLGADAAVAIGILATVITLAATGVVPVTIGALGGVVALVATGTLTANEAYDAVNWSVVFLLAGLLPLGVAMQATGGAGALAAGLVTVGEAVPPLALLAVLYLLTAVVAAVITPVATVVLLIPVAVTTAERLGLDGFPFLLVVTFAAANAFITPIGYQTNLMVYGPGGYRFTDFARVGAPLQLLLTVVTTLAIAAMWPP